LIPGNPTPVTFILQRFKVKVDGPPQVNYTQLGGWMMDMFWWTFRFDLNCIKVAFSGLETSG
jgi:hypothetical protein